MKKKVFLTLLILFTVFGIYKIQAETLSFTMGEIEEQEILTVGDIEYNKYILSTESSTKYIIHNIEIGRYSEFDVVLYTQIYGEDAVGISTVLNMALDLVSDIIGAILAMVVIYFRRGNLSCSWSFSINF